MHDVFILGAGFSKAAHPAMPLLGELSEAAAAHLTVTVPQPSFRTDVEQWLTYLAHDHPWLTMDANLRNQATLIEIRRVIREVILQAEREAVSNPCPQWMNKLIQYWHVTKSAVITLNYDTLVERAVENGGEGTTDVFPWDTYPKMLTAAAFRSDSLFGGQQGGTFRLTKLHGSVNWYCSGRAEVFDGQIYFTIPRGAWAAPNDAQDVGEYEYLEDKEPLIVPPLTDKGVYFGHETLRGLWKDAGNRLFRADRVFCLGYSLPASDMTMRFFLHDNCPDNDGQRVPFYVVNPDLNAADHFRRLLPDTYAVIDDFVGDDPIPRLVEALEAGALG